MAALLTFACSAWLVIELTKGRALFEHLRRRHFESPCPRARRRRGRKLFGAGGAKQLLSQPIVGFVQAEDRGAIHVPVGKPDTQGERAVLV